MYAVCLFCDTDIHTLDQETAFLLIEANIECRNRQLIMAPDTVVEYFELAAWFFE